MHAGSASTLNSSSAGAWICRETETGIQLSAVTVIPFLSSLAARSADNLERDGASKAHRCRSTRVALGRHYTTRVNSTDIPALLRRGAWAMAAGRVAIGLTALAWPSVLARPWVGAAADNVATQVFARSLGARDLALGLGALAALQRPDGEPASASAWVAAGALSDSLDVAASLASWRELPRVGRWLVVLSAGGAALAGAAGALAVRLEKTRPGR